MGYKWQFSVAMLVYQRVLSYFFLAAIDPSPHESFRLSPDEPFVFDMVRLAANQVDRRVRVTLG